MLQKADQSKKAAFLTCVPFPKYSVHCFWEAVLILKTWNGTMHPISSAIKLCQMEFPLLP